MQSVLRRDSSATNDYRKGSAMSNCAALLDMGSEISNMKKGKHNIEVIEEDEAEGRK